MILFNTHQFSFANICCLVERGEKLGCHVKFPKDYPIQTPLFHTDFKETLYDTLGWQNSASLISRKSIASIREFTIQPAQLGDIVEVTTWTTTCSYADESETIFLEEIRWPDDSPSREFRLARISITELDLASSLYLCSQFEWAPCKLDLLIGNDQPLKLPSKFTPDSIIEETKNLLANSYWSYRLRGDYSNKNSFSPLRLIHIVYSFFSSAKDCGFPLLLFNKSQIITLRCRESLSYPFAQILSHAGDEYDTTFRFRMRHLLMPPFYLKEFPLDQATFYDYSCGYPDREYRMLFIIDHDVVIDHDEFSDISRQDLWIEI